MFLLPAISAGFPPSSVKLTFPRPNWGQGSDQTIRIGFYDAPCIIYGAPYIIYGATTNIYGATSNIYGAR